MPDTTQVPPQALEAEMAVLGSMLIERDAVEAALEILEEGHFYKDAHKRIFRAVSNLAERNQAVDLVTVTEEIKRLGWLGEVGGPTCLTAILRSVSTAAHVEHYARLVREKAVLRDLINTATRVVQDCYAEEKDAATLLDEAQAQVLAVAQKQATSDFVSAKDLTVSVVQQLEEYVKRRELVTGIPTGIKRFDQLTAGLQKGNLAIIAARPGQGKSAWALNIAANVVMDEKTPRAVAFFSLEMSGHELINRIIANRAGVDLHTLRTGYMPRDRWSHITTVASTLHDAPLHIDAKGYLTILSLRAKARRLASDLRRQGKELSLIIIDYLQLMQGSSRRVENRQQEVAEISRGLKFLARDLELPVVALSQLNRRTEEKGRPEGKPQLSDLRESGAIEQDADLVALIYREAQYKPQDPTLESKAEIIIAKQRNGPTGSVDVSFVRRFSRFSNLEEGGGETEPAAIEEEHDAFL